MSILSATIKLLPHGKIALGMSAATEQLLFVAVFCCLLLPLSAGAVIAAGVIFQAAG